MKAKRIIAFILVSIMVFSAQLFTLAVSAEGEPAGTAITNAEELSKIESDGMYYLANDILVTGTWESPSMFAGVLDGNGHTIVFSGALVRGGLFNQLNGATVKNLTLSDGNGEQHKANVWKPKSVSVSSNLYVAPLADVGYGIIENVVSNVDTGDQSIFGNSAVAGMIACHYGGNLVMKNCVNMSPVYAGKYAGGFVATSVAAIPSFYDITITECVNYGDIKCRNSAGGIYGHNGGYKLSEDEQGGYALNISIDKCVNYGDICITANQQAGGIMAYFRPAKMNEGAVNISNCINFGNVYNPGVSQMGSSGGQYAGIVARINTMCADIQIKNNVNYAVLTPAPDAPPPATEPKDPNDKTARPRVYGILAFNNGKKYIDCSGNFSAPATTVEVEQSDRYIENARGSAINENTFDTLNTAVPNVFVKSEAGVIGLAWMQTATLDETPPTLSFTVDYSNVKEVVEDEEFYEEEAEGEEESFEEQAEEADEPDETEEKRKGCGSSISSLGIVVLIMVISVSVIVEFINLKVDNKRN